VIATQNPLDQVGTHPLPESQLDRFMLRMEMGYPNRESERAMLTNGDPRLELEKLNSVLNPAAVMELREMANDIHVSAPIVQYIQDILTHSRMGGRGLSPRAGLMCMSLVKSWALISGRSMVLPDDVQDVAPYVFAHRLGANGAARVA